MESLASGVAGTLAPQGVELLSERFATSLACEVFQVCANHGIEGRPSLAGDLTCVFYDILRDRERQVHLHRIRVHVLRGNGRLASLPTLS